MTKYDWVVVGAGFTGAVCAERLARGYGQKVLVVDRRDHIAGNAFDHAGEGGVIVHKYGPHIFHTNSAMVWRYLSQFTDWRIYYHRVLGVIDGQEIPLPFNLNSIEQAFPRFMAEEMIRALVEVHGFGRKVPVLKLMQSDNATLRTLAEHVYQKVFLNYTLKQWDMKPEDLDPAVTARVPILIAKDNRYFQDTFQAMPSAGYTAMFTRILDHENIDVALSCDYQDIKDSHKSARVIFTGPIDEYFSYACGALPYRSLRFEQRFHDAPYVQPVGTVNYPNDFEFTRITDMKHLTGQKSASTILMEEYPQAYVPGENDPYYPIPTADTALRLKPYQERAKALEGKVWFAGRLGDYAYYNMDQACARALTLIEKHIAPVLTQKVYA